MIVGLAIVGLVIFGQGIGQVAVGQVAVSQVAATPINYLSICIFSLTKKKLHLNHRISVKQKSNNVLFQSFFINQFFQE